MTPIRENTADDGIAIGIVGPDDMMDRMAPVLKRFPSFRPILAGYRNEQEAPGLAELLMGEVEVLLFTGMIPYKLAKDKIKFSVPAHYIPLTGGGLFRALYRLKGAGVSGPLSVDTLPRPAVDKAFQELGEHPPASLHYDGPEPQSREEVIRFHKEMFERGLSKGALTGIRSVADGLNALHIPNEWVIPTEQDIIVALERALLATETRRSKEAQIVLGLISVDDSARLFEQKQTEHEVQKLKLDIHRLLLGFAESMEGHLTSLGGEEYLFITTRGAFERETGGYKQIPLAREAQREFGLSLSMGVGFGRSADEAGTHARTALRQAKEAGGDICYIVREDRSVIGPLEMTEPLEKNLPLIDANLIKRAERTGMSLNYISKLAAQVSRKGQIDYTAQELAAVLGVTVRSVHRFLLQWMDSGLVAIVGEQRNPGKGRPKQIYRLLFFDDAFTAGEPSAFRPL